MWVQGKADCINVFAHVITAQHLVRTIEVHAGPTTRSVQQPVDEPELAMKAHQELLVPLVLVRNPLVSKLESPPLELEALVLERLPLVSKLELEALVLEQLPLVSKLELEAPVLVPEPGTA